jgi:hypothetical protein
MNIDEIMEMVMANEDVKNLSHKEKRAARPAFFFAPSGRWPAYRQRYEGIIISNGKRNISK